MTIASIKAQFVQLAPVNPSLVPAGCLFLDSTNGNTPTVKTTGGSLEPTGSAASNFFVKAMVSDGAISANVPVSKKSNGRVVSGDSDGPLGAQNHIGYALQSASGAGQTINVLLNGPNLSGALVGLGFSSGQEIFLSETGGYTNNPASFTGANDRIVRLGVADCGAGVDGTTAVDLIAFTEVIVEP